MRKRCHAARLQTAVNIRSFISKFDISETAGGTACPQRRRAGGRALQPRRPRADTLTQRRNRQTIDAQSSGGPHYTIGLQPVSVVGYRIGCERRRTCAGRVRVRGPGGSSRHAPARHFSTISKQTRAGCASRHPVDRLAPVFHEIRDTTTSGNTCLHGRRRYPHITAISHGQLPFHLRIGSEAISSNIAADNSAFRQCIRVPPIGAGLALLTIDNSYWINLNKYP